MIKKFFIKKFGKFRNREFEFAPVTAFIGDNESGKSTIFDGMFDAVCKPANQRNEGKSLTQRYGEKKERQTEIEFVGNSIELDAVEFLNVYAIQAGRVTITFGKDKWLSNVRNAVFSGGIDVAGITAELQTKSAEKGNVTHLKEFNKVEDILKQAQSELDNLNNKRRSLLENENSIEINKNTLEQLKAELEEKENELQLLLAKEKENATAKSLRDKTYTLADFDKSAEIKAYLENNSVFEKDESNEIANLEKKRTGLNHEIAVLKNEIQSLENQLQKMEINQNKETLELQKKKSSEGTAARLIEKIQQDRFKGGSEERTIWSLSFLVPAIISFLAGMVFLAGAFSDIPRTLSYIISGFLLISSAALIFFARKKMEIQKNDDSGIDTKLVMSIKDEWRSASGESLSSETPDGLIREFSLWQAGLSQLEKNTFSNAANISELQKEKIHKSKTLQEAEIELENRSKDIETWFKERSVKDSGAYHSRLTEFAHKNAEYEKINQKLTERMRADGEQSLDVYRSRLAADIGSLSKEVTSRIMTDEESNRLQKKIQTLKTEIEGIQQKKFGLTESLAGEKGAFKAAMGSLPSQIYKLEVEIDELNQKLQQITINRKAAGLALNIFETIKIEQDDVFLTLSHDISRIAKGLFPEGRTFEISDFDGDAILVEDRGGKKRKIDHVSTATKDAFFLAARMSFALKSRREPGFIILDEPFASFDEARKQNALQYLIQFAKETQWQVVLFTKDPEAGDTLSQAAPQPGFFILHNLNKV